MSKVEFTIEIARPPEEVFAYVTDPTNLPEWQSGATEGRLESEAPGVGARIVEVRKFMGKRIESTLEVTEWDRPRRFSFKVVKGPVPFAVQHEFEQTGTGTRLHVVGEGDSGGFFKLAEPLVTRAVEKQSKADFNRLKQLLEQRS